MCTASRRLWAARAVAFSVAALCGTVATAQSGARSGLGRAPSDAELRAWDIAIGPAGEELPEGSGTVGEGAAVFANRGCTTCHGPTGVEGPAVVLIGGEVTPSTNYFPIAHWPFAPTIWSYIRRAMPYDRPGHLTPDEVYALTAFLLSRNGIIEADAVMNAETLPRVVMPHRAEYTVPEPWKPGTPRGFRFLP